jgi:hypothetical protein
MLSPHPSRGHDAVEACKLRACVVNALAPLPCSSSASSPSPSAFLFLLSRKSVIQNSCHIFPLGQVIKVLNGHNKALRRSLPHSPLAESMSPVHSLKEQLEGKPGSMSAMVREALDDYFKSGQVTSNRPGDRLTYRPSPLFTPYENSDNDE